MKKTKSGKRRSTAEPKLSASPKSIDAYLAGVPEPARATLQKVRAAIRSAVPPGATETNSYKIPAFKHDQVIIWFAAFASHCRIFPPPGIIQQFTNPLKTFTLPKTPTHSTPPPP